jgi:DNA-binding NarL/FixJ family response regulator
VGLGLSALLLALLGDVPAALRAGDEALSFAGAHESFVHRGAAGWSLGIALIEAGDVERGRSVVLDLCGGPDLRNLPPSVSDGCFDALARTDVEAGRIDAARGWAQRSEALAAAAPVAGVEAASLRTRARVLSADGAPAEAAELAARSARELDALGMRLEAARSRLVAGQALVAAGDEDAAANELELAEAGFHACEAEPLRRRAAGALRGVGRRPPQRAAVGDGGDGGALSGLTERQREIARLVAEGSTNREIAATLVLTTKSVDNHLARTFARLDITSRTALTALVISEEG